MPLTAVVTGGATKVGKAIAASLITHGSDVVITGRHFVELHDAAVELGSRARPMVVEASSPRSVREALAVLPARIDVLVVTAEAARRRSRQVDDLTGLHDAWLAGYESLVLGAVLLTSALSPRLVTAGRVVLLGRSDGVGYQAAHAGLVSYAGGLAKALRPRGITVNTVAPGPLVGDLVAVVRFLLSEDARDITGQVLRVGDQART
jgi:3-oxoacyl-[acyl-carrier protein] reductase